MELKCDFMQTDCRLNSRFTISDVTSDQGATCGRMLERDRSGGMTLMPTHHVNDEGDLSGFCYRCSGSARGSALPITRKMFFGHTAVECQDSEARILELMSNPDVNRCIMDKFLHARRGDAATMECIPDNSDAMMDCQILQGSGLRTEDCKSWTPELPEVIGVYHAYLRGYTRQVRTHKTFLVCSGGLDLACNQFCNMLVDLGDQWTAGEIAISEEAWWLRRACSRGRCRVIKELCDAFGLHIPHIIDYNSHEQSTVAIPAIETVMHDLTISGNASDGIVSVFNECMDTTRPFNGILTRMHAAEGYWLFRGSNGNAPHGSTFGDARKCGAFPVRQPKIRHGSRHSMGVAYLDPCVVYRSATSTSIEHYQCFDENFLKKLEQTDWDRNNGVVELMPIIVGMGTP